MNIFQHIDCDLSNEFIDENVTTSSVKTSIKLTKNMSNSPFNNAYKAQLVKASSCPVQGFAEYSSTPKSISKLKMMNQNSEGPCKEPVCVRVGLRDEIKSLLQKAIQIRNSSRYASEKQISCEGFNFEHNSSSSSSCHKVVTMEDVFAPY
ncbi:unnamed protein product [Moneuplotes crassus]|uniref:Uncharacterized protein n=1 Tax=Euplotes crassus TaxID=5936 RepID=A0AAD1U5Q0_EUPCR|nr:unnamed protein product [Moneuplotes crassus]